MYSQICHMNHTSISVTYFCGYKLSDIAPASWPVRNSSLKDYKNSALLNWVTIIIGISKLQLKLNHLIIP